ncbi:cytidylyltransferase domain-containing protein [Aquirufa ecclesiirivi]|uniref:cytidylyltransferase domain-containing protein n=1 Tax=Aquirufa ecclesiirivi TaxID=2715124 RepID=UPI00140BAC80|nr:glycosyltransferase family protein [Aquirufa ecclesiirivi]NHC48144.1 spore coat biosynthesis protein F [Aquirufa ecclesiirivi]
MSKPRVVASIEARMGSSRLPGKVLYDIYGKPSIERLISRLQLCKNIDSIILATTDKPGDDPLAEWAINNNIAIYRGSEDDVLNRVVEAQRSMNSDIVVEITGDCILLDPNIIDLGINTYLANKFDVVTNARIPSYAQGLDVQVYSLEILEQVEKTIFDPAVREHVSLYFYENPLIYSVCNLMAPPQWERPNLRLQLDYKEDLDLIKALFQRIEPRLGYSFGIEAIIEELNTDPTLEEINRHCEEKPVR